MTKLTADRPVVRETAAFDRTDQIIVELHPKRIRVRLKGKRTGLDVTYDQVLDLARKLAYRRAS